MCGPLAHFVRFHFEDEVPPAADFTTWHGCMRMMHMSVTSFM
jgi:hypothetical protein